MTYKDDGNDLNPREFVELLNRISIYDGELFGRLAPLQDAEAARIRDLEGFRGYAALASAGLSFILETVEFTNKSIRPNIKAPLSASHSLFLERLAHYFRTLRASDNLAKQGYPLHAYTLLRNLFDSVVLTAAVASGLTDFYKLEGMESQDSFDALKFRSNRRKEERKIRSLMTGALSGLTDDARTAIAHWDVLFDDETHGARLSRTQTVEWFKGAAPLPFLPTFSQDAAAIFMNRHCEIAWMVHRLLPLVQPKAIQFPVEWKQKWLPLDRCFRQCVLALSTKLQKPIGQAMVELVEVKFPFHADSEFWD